MRCPVDGNQQHGSRRRASAASTARAILALLLNLAAAGRLASQAPTAFIATRDLTIPAATADLSRVGDMLVSSAGDILVTQVDDRTILVFSPSGTRSIIGRNGEGPGEFRNLRLAGWLHDSVWVSDPALERVSIFSPSYRFVRSFRYPERIVTRSGDGGPEPTIEFLSPGAMYDDGSLRLNVLAARSSTPLRGWAAGSDSGKTVVLRAKADGTLLSRIALVPRESACYVDVGDGAAFYVPLCGRPIHSLFEGSQRFVSVTLDEPRAPYHSYRLVVRDANGTIRVSRTYAATPVTIPSAIRDSVFNGMKKTLSDPHMPPKALALFERTPVPTTFPPIRGMLVGRDGTLWLDERRAAPGHHWIVFDSVGTLIGTLTIPESVTIRVADLRSVWGLETDSDGLEGIVRYRLNRAK
jgi:hypothetical protein